MTLKKESLEFKFLIMLLNLSNKIIVNIWESKPSYFFIVLVNRNYFTNLFKSFLSARLNPFLNCIENETQ